MRVSPGVAPVTDIVTVPVVALYVLDEERFPHVALYRLTCPVFWGGMAGQLEHEPVWGRLLSLTVNVKDDEGATNLV